MTTKLTEAQRLTLVEKQMAKKLKKLRKELMNKNKKKKATGGQVGGNEFVASIYGGCK
jgi:prolyl-tRNA editing enzyme YbaK/EbsC (Cys-tRNA(Pro) deacylase)|tara:strand:- start:274 stop:447 length:174 start_codon:yes stop_codon:yes gene_type:complete